MYTKYPRTPHVPWSPGISSDDIRANQSSLSELLSRGSVVITEKMDGESTTMYRDHIHARSIDSAHHQSRSRVKQIHSEICHLIPEGWRVCGENMQAEHSIHYEQLLDWFLVFSIWTAENHCLDWGNTLDWIELLGLRPVPILFQGDIDLNYLQEMHGSLDLSKQEGFVIRSYQSFDFAAFSKNVFKWVRRDHVETDQHWMNAPMVENAVIQLPKTIGFRSGNEAG